MDDEWEGSRAEDERTPREEDRVRTAWEGRGRIEDRVVQMMSSRMELLQRSTAMAGEGWSGDCRRVGGGGGGASSTASSTPLHYYSSSSTKSTSSHGNSLMKLSGCYDCKNPAVSLVVYKSNGSLGPTASTTGRGCSSNQHHQVITTPICRRCNEVFSKYEALEKHHLLKHAGQLHIYIYCVCAYDFDVKTVFINIL